MTEQTTVHTMLANAASASDFRSPGGGWLEQLIFRGPGSTEGAIETVGLFMLILAFSTFFFVLLVSLSIYWAIKYRRRPGVPAARSPSHNTPLEIFWTVVPSSSLLVIFLLGFWGYMDKIVPHGDALLLDVTGRKWAWSVTYPNGAESQWAEHLDERTLGTHPQTGETISARNVQPYPVFVVAEGQPYHLRMSSQDVIHSFWIPDFKVKMDVFPNRYTGYGFTAPMLGADASVSEIDGRTYIHKDYWIFCAEYCGDNHAEMAAVLRVVSRADYQHILSNVWTTDVPPVQLGQIVAQQKCATCHSTDGSGGVGPTWYQAWGNPVPLANGQTLQLDGPDDWANYARESILQPQAKIHAGYGGTMPSFQGQLSDAQLNGILAYMASLSDAGQDYARRMTEAYEAGGEAPAEGEPAGEADAASGEHAEPTDRPADQPDDQNTTQAPGTEG